MGRLSNGILIPDPTIDRVPGTVTAHMAIANAVTPYEGLNYRMVLMEIPDPNDPTDPSKNIRITGFSVTNFIKTSKSLIGSPETQAITDMNSVSLSRMLVPSIVTDYHYPNTDVPIPLAELTWKTIGPVKMADIFARVQGGDITALRELKGMPILIDMDVDNSWYQK